MMFYRLLSFSVPLLTFATAALAQAPVNDNCSTATVISLGLTSFDNTSATDSGLTQSGATCGFVSGIGSDLWYSFTPALTASYDFETSGTGFQTFDTRFTLYDDLVPACPPLLSSIVDCDDDSGSGTWSSMRVSLIAGNPYLLRVGGFGSANGVMDMGITLTPQAPSNDDCASATVVSGFGSYAYDNANATTDGADLGGFCDMGPTGGENIHNDVWFVYTPNVSGCTYISTFGNAGYDTRLAVYSSVICPNDPATVLACNDDEAFSSGGFVVSPFEAGLDVNLVGGTPYLIRVGNFGSFILGGPATLVIAAGPQAAANNASGSTQIGAPGCGSAPFFPEFCFGDGGNQMGCTNCPCGNANVQGSGAGCLNSAGTGLRISASGDPSVSLPSGNATDLRFSADGAPPKAFCILNSGDGLAPGNPANPCFGMTSGAQAASFDGLRCAIMNTRRHGGRSADANGDVGVTNDPWGGEGGPPVGIANAGGGFAAGQTRFFQLINRDEPMAVCMRGLNTSQAVEVTFVP